MKRKLSIASTFSILLAAVGTICTIFVPWWGMKFFAPQYPEGLDIVVTPTSLEGDIDNINALNHYIGMREFSNETFPELQYMPYIIIGLAVLMVITAILRKKSILYGMIVLFAASGIIGILDMKRWLKDFGTNLDPMAPIDMDPFVPPILGENIIANFVTHSYFTIGGYLLAIVFILLVFPLWKDRGTYEKTNH